MNGFFNVRPDTPLNPPFGKGGQKGIRNTIVIVGNFFFTPFIYGEWRSRGDKLLRMDLNLCTRPGSPLSPPFDKGGQRNKKYDWDF
jgi:hypothetical protein